MSEDEKLVIINEYRKRFIRWQHLTQTQLSNTNNLILTFTLGFIVFSVSKTGLKAPNICGILFTMLLGYFVLLASLFLGIWLTINRLRDFRKTKDLIKFKRQRYEKKGDLSHVNYKINLLTTETSRLGKRTWHLLQWQLWLFFIGVFLLLSTIVIQNN